MCFSPQADLVGGVAIGAIGWDTIRHRRHRRAIALAALPLLLAFHQFDEAFVWWGLQGSIPAAVGHVATWIYLVIAFCILPIYVPAAVMGVEPTRRLRLRMLPFLVLGAAVSLVLLVAMIHGPLSANLGLDHVEYNILLPAGGVVVGLYVVATCGSLLFSGERHIVAFGAANLVAASVLAWLTISGFASLWCAWAAVVSGAIALHLRLSPVHRSTAPSRRPASAP